MARLQRRFPGGVKLGQRQVLAATVTAAVVTPGALHVVQAPTTQSHEQNRARHAHVYTPYLSQRGAASLALEALVTPPQTQHTILASARSKRGQRDVLVVSPRPYGLIFTPAAGPATPPRTTTVVQAHPPRQARRSEILEPRPYGLIFTPAGAVVTPSRTVWIVEAAQQPRARRLGHVLAPRPSGLQPATAPRTVTLTLTRSTRQQRNGSVATTRVIVVPPLVTTPPRTVSVIRAPALPHRLHTHTSLLLGVWPRATFGPTFVATPPITNVTHATGSSGKLDATGANSATHATGASGQTGIMGDDGATHATGSSGRTQT